MTLQRNEKVVHRAIGDGEILLHLETGQYHGLNGVAALVWSLADGSRSVSEIAVEVGARFAAPPGAVEADVLRFVEQMRERHLLVAVA